ncbi:MAG: acyclic terpene utilization AtuA family protein [Deltaproteobacteria bacterium]|nr:MAG: acyclic terpene utilization AtuA family protein [Deltaproteobacteria bacterium]
MKDEVKVLSPTAILGYGFPRESLKEGLARKPDVIAVDAGSTDPGPHFLGLEPEDLSGIGQFGRVIRADLEPLLEASLVAGIPLIIGSAGGAGGTLHLMGVVYLIRDIAEKRGFHFKLATITAEFDQGFVLERLRAGKVEPLGPVPELTEDEVRRSVRIVGQMGVEPFIEALNMGAQVIAAGRANDPAMFAALPIKRGFDPGLSLHMAKILECGAIAADPGSGSDCLFGTVRRDHFIVEPTNSARVCTVRSVAAHTLYEKSDPWRLYGPGGMVDLSRVRFEQDGPRHVKVTGSRFVPDSVYRIKLEGATRVGYRTICIAGIRDPGAIAHLDEMIEETRKRTVEQFAEVPKDEWELHFKVYGRDGVMGRLEPRAEAAHEVGLLIEAIAGTQELASSICMFAHTIILHYGFPGRLSTAGNLAFPLSPEDIPCGSVCRFNIYHLIEVDDPVAPFPIEITEV